MPEQQHRDQGPFVRRLQRRHKASELLAVALVIAYLAFSLPAVAAGFAATSVGLHVTTAVYSVGVVALGVIALAAQRRRARATPSRP